jgi:hypothetical protein
MSSLSDADDAAPLAPIARLVATIKAERAAAPSAGTEEREHLPAELRRLAGAHEQERGQWQEAMDALTAELDQARAAARAAEARHAQETRQHRRAMADLELMHEHQRSIWQLDRRRLEITIAGQETTHQARRSPFAVAAALLVAGIFGVALVADHRVNAPTGEAADTQASFPSSGSSR